MKVGIVRGEEGILSDLVIEGEIEEEDKVLTELWCSKAKVVSFGRTPEHHKQLVLGIPEDSDHSIRDIV